MPDLNPERALVGAAIRTPAALDDTNATSDDFADIRLGALWGLITQMRNTGEPVDHTTINANLGRIPEIERRGIGPGEIFDLYQAAPVAASADYYARLVVNDAARRKLVAAGTRIVQLADGDSAIDPAEIVEMARAEIDSTHRATATTRVVSDRIDATLDDLSTPSRATPTPWGSINQLIDGWRPGALYVVGARPGVGKTILGVEAAIGLAQHGPVAFSSLEMPEAELHARLIARVAEVSISRLDRREVTPEDWKKIAAARQRLNLDISIDDRGLVTTTDIRSHARSLSRRGQLAGIVVDYLQLMSSPRGDKRPRHEVVASFSRDLKLLAKELDCPVIALSQLNRGSMDRADKRPQLSDLRESGAVEQDSDVVILLHEDTDDDTKVSALVAKNRHGARGDVDLIRKGWHSALIEHQWGE